MVKQNIFGRLNNSLNLTEIWKLSVGITDSVIDAKTTFFIRCANQLRKEYKICKNVFNNFNCTILDLGGVTIEDDVIIAPELSLLYEVHPISAKYLKSLSVDKIHIKKNAVIGANTTILHGVNIGENSVISVVSVVSKDVNYSLAVGGNPA